MAERDMVDVLAEWNADGDAVHKHDLSAGRSIVAALVAAAHDGPLVADVPCQVCGGDGRPDWRNSDLACHTCTGTGIVRYVWHRADPDSADTVRAVAEAEFHDYPGIADNLRAAARLIGGDRG